MGGRAVGGRFDVGSGRLRPGAGSEKRRKEEQEATRNETSHLESPLYRIELRIGSSP